MTSKILDDFAHPEKIKWEGSLSCGIGSFPDGRVSAAARGKLVTEDISGDWTGYGALQLTVYNPLGRPLIGGINIYDQSALDSPDLQYGDYVGLDRSLLIGEGITHVIICIDPLQTWRGNRMLDTGKIRKISISMPCQENEPCVSISSLRLSKEYDQVDGTAAAQPGDSILLIKHLDVSCFTFEPDNYKEPVEIVALFKELEFEKTKLQDAVRIAEMNGKQAYYAHAALVAADIALKGRPMLAWHYLPRAKRANMSEALVLVRTERRKMEDLLSSRCHEDDEDDSNLPLNLVKPFPVFKDLRISGKRFIDKAGKPVLICSMSYHNEGALMRFFAVERHKMEIFAVGGGSRYDIERSPVYEVFQKYSGTKRIGWKGWCGHLIKDHWAMGGRKENVIICLENPKILEAIEKYNRIHAGDWLYLPDLVYVILGYELTYMCYCEESLRRFRIWLEERHKTIYVLNEKWNTVYTGFDEVFPPETEGHGPMQGTNRAAWFDWADWNSRRFTDHLKWSRDQIKELNSNIPICAGGSSSMFSPNNSTTGIDEELIINEVDDVILHEGRDIMGIDLFHALSEFPKPLVDPEQGGDCSRWMLNYLHGKSAISKFWWPRQPSRQFPNSTLDSPLHGTMPITLVAEHLTTALDVRRLNEEITAFWDIPKEVAILYSKTNMLQVDTELVTADRTPYLNALRECYEAARCLDTGITFISERQLIKGKAKTFKLLILPAVKYCPEEVFRALDSYVKDGGIVFVMPESLVMDEYNRPAEYLEQWGIGIEHVDIPGIAGFGDITQKYDQNMERTVMYCSGKATEAVAFEKSNLPFLLKTEALFQTIKVNCGDTITQDKKGNPLLVRIPRQSGWIWYLAGFPNPESLLLLLDRLFSLAGVIRQLKVTDLLGNRIPGVEARLVRRETDDLVYVANESGHKVEFMMETGRPWCTIRELRSLQYYEKPSGFLEKDQVVLFSFSEDLMGNAWRNL